MSDEMRIAALVLTALVAGACLVVGFIVGWLWRGVLARFDLADERDRADAAESALGAPSPRPFRLGQSVHPETTARAPGAPRPKPQR